MTQLYRTSSSDDDGNDSSASQTGGTTTDAALEKAPLDGRSSSGVHDCTVKILRPCDHLKCWDDLVHYEDDGAYGSMNDLKAARLKSNSCWAKSTANQLQLDQEDEEEGFDALVDLFDSTIAANQADTSDSLCTQADADASSTESMLASPSDRKIALELVSSVSRDPDRKAAVERVCGPNWKRNIHQTFLYDDPKEMVCALERVKQARCDLASMKTRILQAFDDRAQTLELFEKSILQASRKRTD